MRRRELDSTEDPARNVLLVSGFVCRYAPQIGRFRHGKSTLGYLLKMLVCGQAFEYLDPVLGQIKLLQFLQLVETTQTTDPVILRDIRKNQVRHLKVEKLNVWGRLQGFHRAYLVVVEIQHL